MNSMGEKDLILSLRAQGAGVAEARDLAYVAGALAVVPDPEIDADFANELESMLMAEFDAQMAPNVTQLRPAQPVRPVRQAQPAATTATPIATVIPLGRRKHVIRKAMAMAIAAALMLALPIAASANALPSSPMYKGKLAIEDMHSWFLNGAAKGFYLLQRAKTRGDEAVQEAALGNAVALVKATALMKAEQAEGTQLILSSNPTDAELAQAASTLRGISEQLAGLLPQLSSAARGSVLSAIATVNQTATSLEGQLAANNAISLPAIGVAVPADSAAVKAPASSGSDAQVSQSSNQQSGSTQGGSTTPTDDTKKRTDDATHQACQAPGSADGLTDVTGPLGKVFCG